MNAQSPSQCAHAVGFILIAAAEPDEISPNLPVTRTMSGLKRDHERDPNLGQPSQ